MVVDTRNRYETAIGTLLERSTLKRQFSEFPEWAEKLAADPASRPKKLAMFCTGGIAARNQAPDENNGV